MIFLLACAEPRPTEESALKPAFARVDTDGDGRIVEAELDPVTDRMPTVEQLDQDKSGAVELAELVKFVGNQDPLSAGLTQAAGWGNTFGKAPKKGPNEGAPGRSDPGPKANAPKKGASVVARTPEQDQEKARQQVLQVLTFLSGELRGAGRPAPTDEELDAAAAAGRLDAPEAREMLARLEAESKAAGLDFPPSLRR